MPNSDLDVHKLGKYVKDQLDNVTCINCCKYYQVATTAPCGHSLCQTCYKGRRTCPLCALRIDKKALRLNSPLQNRTEHAIMLRETFESLFDKQLDDFTLNTDQPQHVKEWLANSRNQFSVPITSSSEFTEETAKPLHHITSEIQIHTRNEKLKQPERKTITMNIQQDDWDKIEEMPEIETIKSHENPVGPMDIETFDFLMDDKDYNANNPRRSLRNKQDKNNKPPKNVKRRGNKYNKLSKENQNKLNISIEMCKKANLAATKKAPSKSLQGSSDGITPEIAAPDDAAIKNTDFNNDNRNDTENFKYLPTSAINTNKVISNKMQNNSSLSHSQDIKQKGIDLQTKTKENIEQLNQNALTSKISFFKRGPLKATFLDKNNTHVNNPIVKNKNNDKIGTDDINITIKIGNILTNINIEKKENDVKLKIKNNREVQTSLDNCNNKDEYNMRSSENDPNTQRIETTTNNIVVKVYKDVAVCTEHSISKVQIEKSLSTKKNTTSAETSTAQFEITESEEREFADHMDNIPLLNKKDENELSKLGCTSKSKQDKQLSFKLDAIPSDLEFLNDFDVFDSESVKEDNIQQLKPAKSTPSVILMSTVKGKSTSQRNINKRSYVSDTEDTSNTKKIRKSQESFEVNKITPETLLKENDILDEESENINDDANMSQVFASTNADMDLQKTGTSTLLRTQISNTQTSNHKNIAEFGKSNIQQQDILKKTNGEQTNQGANQKCSENVFSLSGKEGNSEILKTKNYKPFGQTQQLELKSLAPEGGCDRAIENKEKLSSQNNMDLIEFCTPIQDDDDKSIVEETPQKTTSFLKNRVKKQTKTLNEDEAQCSSAINDKSSNDARDPRKHPDKDDSVNVICASDSADEITEGRKSASETPLTITKFAEKISHRSTPLAKRSLDMSRRSAADDPEETLCPSSVVAAKTTQEREFMSEAFERSQSLGAGAPCVAGSCAGAPCVAGSCLAPAELAALRQLCARRGWRYVDKYTTELTHLVVGVDEENQSQRSVKYMCAVAGSKWVVSFAWVEKCLHVNGFVDEEPYEALDSSGEPGPRRARLARTKLLHGITFHCMPPFTIIDIQTLKEPYEALDSLGELGPRRARLARTKLLHGITFHCMPPFTIIDIQTLKGILEAAGGRVVGDPGALRASAAPAMLLAEPESTQEDRFIYLAMELKIVPMNYEWVVNCLGTYTLKPIFDLLLCPAALLTTVVSNWPSELISSCDE